MLLYYERYQKDFVFPFYLLTIFITFHKKKFMYKFCPSLFWTVLALAKLNERTRRIKNDK